MRRRGSVTHVSISSERSDIAELIADKASELLILGELSHVLFVKGLGPSSGHRETDIGGRFEEIDAHAVVGDLKLVDVGAWGHADSLAGLCLADQSKRKEARVAL